MELFIKTAPKWVMALPFLFLSCFAHAQKTVRTELRVDVLVIGGGTGGTAAGIQSARLGVRTAIVEPTTWLGGMISAAGVTATDGNHKIGSGIWKEFRENIYKVYGGPKAVETGWVSNTLFEAHVADSIFKKMVSREKNLSVHYGWKFDAVLKRNGKAIGARFSRNKKQTLLVYAGITIDATEMGDAMASAGIPYDLGMEAGSLTGENVGVTETNNIVQDLTYVAVLKDYGAGADCTIVKPAGYDPKEFDGACTDYYVDKTRPAPQVDAKKMLDYGRLPGNKYMLNWPKFGNDTYLNIVEMNEAQRNKELLKAKEKTKRFIYFIQHQLGFRHLGLTVDEFPTADRMAIMPYYREGRRVKGIVRYTMRNLAEPFSYGDPLYRTGISVGDYPIDHHHKENLTAPQHLDFYPVPSYNVPLGALIPEKGEGLIIAEKGISVSNIVNGTTRLQPCVMLTGQAAGALAALCIKEQKSPRDISVRLVQTVLLNSGAYLMPYIDVLPQHTHFKAVQRVGATGILKGKGVPYKWANQTWFYPDSAVVAQTFLQDWYGFTGKNNTVKNQLLSVDDAILIVQAYAQGQKGWTDETKFREYVTAKWSTWGFGKLDVAKKITKLELAVLIDDVINPFQLKDVDFSGNFKKIN